MSRAVWLDRGPASLLACCADCVPVWRAPATDDCDAWRQLSAHRAACHGENLLSRQVRRSVYRVQNSTPLGGAIDL